MPFNCFNSLATSSTVSTTGSFFFSLARTASVLRLSREILADARQAGAQTIVVACPMCHSNLDFRQRAMLERGEEPMPIVFLSELVGLAFGLDSKALGLGRHFVETGKVVRRPSPSPAAAAPKEVA